MKKRYLSILTLGLFLLGTTSCMDEFDPQGDVITGEQAGNAPNSYNNFVSSITSTLAGQFNYSPRNKSPYDFGYTSFFLQRDVMGNDIALDFDGNWYQGWYTCSVGLGPIYALCQLPWTCYYGWIKNCNTVLSLAGDEPEEAKRAGAGIAYAMRAMFYMDLARMFAQKTYALDPKAETVPIITHKTSLEDYRNNPRATNEDMWNFIVEDLNKAEDLIKDYQRDDKYTPDLSVVYGLKARAYLVMEKWEDAAKYAKMAQNGYTLSTEEVYTNRETGFNTPTDAWMFGVRFKSTDPNITENDADSSWGSIMCLEAAESGCGYASSYGHQLLMDRHLYETIPYTDFRKKCFVDFKIDEESTSPEEVIKKLEAYSDVPQSVYSAGYEGEGEPCVGGLSLKFRVNGGAEGRANQKIGFLVSVPLMRVEEMYLIEAEAVGMQPGKEAEGIELLKKFALTRDAKYEYGKHDEAYGNNATTTFQNEVWWQRRVELWGEGFATFDIKRLNKGVIRSYKNTNHVETFRWNTTTPPDWMNLCIVQTETDNNDACTNNPTPLAPTSDSPEYIWTN